MSTYNILKIYNRPAQLEMASQKTSPTRICATNKPNIHFYFKWAKSKQAHDQTTRKQNGFKTQKPQHNKENRIKIRNHKAYKLHAL